MKKIITICALLLTLGTLLVGCTPEKQEPENTENKQSGSPAINYEIPDEVEKIYDKNNNRGGRYHYYNAL